ncbi:VWA domain-containing protein [Gryllotalpicola protaetiae]|uniref:VWA domain-containing protein n=1 Tax=Gryllotalpicola protaetiae TaxID=2419771 RepID=A0A387BQ92_9MICO|nr:VWA domain-containing protein [Gryllotalpicola protaetiae]AYG04682.1 VWA domain-containing protein [Gryllotalpicola protaetiae]
MSFTWPWALLALVVIPALLLTAWWLRRRRRRAAVRVASIAVVRQALPARSSWVRRIPVALMLLGIGVLAVGAARPQASVTVPSKSSTIVLALDVSGSMCSTDVKPNRITAAEQQASTFITSLAGGPKVGLVAFAGAAGVLVPPTGDTKSLLDGLKGLTTSRGTAIGQAVMTSLDAISKVDPSVAPTGTDSTAPDMVPAPKPGAFAPDAIVLLTDGANTQGIDPQTAAKFAAERHVRVFTIGFGTTTPSSLVCPGSQLNDGFGGFGGGGFGPGAGGGFDGGGFGGRGNVLQIDEGALKQIAKTTGGTYHRAQNADELKSALASLPSKFSLVKQHVDLAAWFAGIGGLLIAVAVGLSLWFSRVRTPGGIRQTTYGGDRPPP